MLRQADVETFFVEVCAQCRRPYGALSRAFVNLCGSSSCYNKQKRENQRKPAEFDAVFDDPLPGPGAEEGDDEQA